MEGSGNESGDEKWSPGLWKSETCTQGTVRTEERGA